MRVLRQLVPFEVAAVLAIAIAPLPERLPAAALLFVAATASRWLRGRTWGEVTRGSGAHAAIGALAGLVALGVAVVVASRGMAALVLPGAGERSVEWSEHAVVRGNASLVLVVAVYVGVTAVAAELALRGWLVERVLELSPGSPVLPVLVGAFAEALIVPGDLATRIGAGLFGIGLGWMYVSAGRTAMPGILARVAFQCGAVALEGLRLVG